MAADSVVLPRHLVNQVLTHAQQAPDNEVCGLIGLSSEHTVSLYPIRNIASDTHTLFQMDPAEQIEAMRQMREQGEELFAIYHSHPHAPGLPSVEDLAQAAYPEALYLIISLNTVGVLEMRGFHIRNGEAEDVELHVHEQDLVDGA